MLFGNAEKKHGKSKINNKNMLVLWLSMIFWSCYMIISGILLTFVPNIFEIIFNSKLYYDNWIRLFGALAFIIGLGYVAILLAPFNIYLILWTIIARYFFSIVSITFFLLNFFAAPILFVGIFDALNATWTLIGLYLILK